MANEQSGSPLRRWRPFYSAFGAIDEAIEAAGHPRAAFREVRVRIVQLLRGAADDGVAEQLCAALDDAMAELLETLRVAHVPHSALASTDLTRAVGALGNHGSARIRSLVGDVVRGWRPAIDGYVPTATAVKEELDKGISTVIADGNARGYVVPAAAAEVHKNKLQMLPTAAAEVHEKKLRMPPAKMLPPAAAELHKMKLHMPPAKTLPAATVAASEVHKKKLYVPPAKMFTAAATVSGRQNTSETKKSVVAQSEKMEAKKPIVARSEKMEAEKPVVAQSEKMETTKRKLREGYQEAERLKRQHTIQRIKDKEAPKLLEQSQRKIHRGPARCRTSSGVGRSLLPSLQLI